MAFIPFLKRLEARESYIMLPLLQMALKRVMQATILLDGHAHGEGEFVDTKHLLDSHSHSATLKDRGELDPRFGIETPRQTSSVVTVSRTYHLDEEHNAFKRSTKFNHLSHQVVESTFD